MKKLLLVLTAFFCFCASWAQQPVAGKAVAFAVSSPVRDFSIAKPEPGKTTSRTLIGENEPINKSNGKIIKEIAPGIGGNTEGVIQSSTENLTNLVSAPITSFDCNSSADNQAAYGVEAGFIRQTITEMLATTIMFKQHPAGRGDIEQPAPSRTSSYLNGLADRLMHCSRQFFIAHV